MQIPRLKDTDKDQVRAAKTRANDFLRAKRRALTAEIKHCSSPLEQRKLEQELERLQIITGTPVLLTHNGNVICQDYDKLKKIDRSLDPVYWRRSVQLTSSPWPRLIINYHKNYENTGCIELYQLPDYQTELLSGLPILEIAN